VQSKINSSNNRVNFVIAKEIFSETITKWIDDLLDNDREHRFVLHHSNLSVNNIYIDEDFNITCIINWAFCFAVLLFMLFTVLNFSQSRHEVNASLFSTFEHEFRHALEKNTQRQDVDIKNVLY
jgi:hypothetical protein